MIFDLKKCGWIECNLDDLVEYVTSGSRDWSKYYSEEGANFIRTQDINKNELNLSNVAKVDLPEKVEGKRTLVKENDLLITITGANVGKCARVSVDPPESYVSQSVALVRLLNPEISSFIQRQIISPEGDQTALQKAAYGMGRPVLNLKNIREFKVKLPPLAEQKVIAEKLDKLLAKVDSIKARLDAVPDTLKRFRQSVLAAAVSGKLTEEVTPWKKKKLNDCFDCIDGDRGSNYPKKHEYLSEGPCLFLSTKNVRQFGFNFKETVFISEEKDKLLRKGKLERGDLIITTRGTLGYVASYDDSVSFELVRINSGMLILRKLDPDYVNDYFKILIASPVFQKMIENQRTGSAQPQLPAKILKEFDLPVPSNEEQTEIVRRVEQLFVYADKVEAEVNASQERVNKLTQSILAKAFRGELTAKWREQNPELISGENSAEALLEKIKAEREKLKPKKKARARKKA